jgi:uncharacterized iron-regulated membrane protein
MKFRKPVLILHRYAGIMAGILLAIIGLTGSGLIFAEEVHSILHPQLLQVAPEGDRLSHQILVDIARKAYPAEWKTQRITVPQKPEKSYTVLLESANEEYTNVYLNPYNGKILGSQPMKQSLPGFLLKWHVHLFAGDIGMQIVGVCGILLLLLGITGLLLVPKLRKLKNNLTIRWRSPWQLINYDLHKVTGILAVLFLSLLAFTGAAMIFWTPFEAAVNWLTRTPKTPEFVSKVVPGISSMKLDDILVKAEAALPEAKFYPAKEPEATFDVWMQFPLENVFNKDPFLSLDQYTGKVLHVDNPKQASIATRILNSQYILHVGRYGGLATRLLYFAIGLAPIGLFITGFLIWWSKTYAAKLKKR